MFAILAVLIVAAVIMVGPKVIADAYATAKAAKSENFDFINKDRERRAKRGEKWAAAWAARRRARDKQAGGDGDYRPGWKAYVGDLYHGFWETKLEKRKAKLAARPPFVYDPERKSWDQRVDDAILSKVDELRNRRGYDPKHGTPEPEPQAAEQQPEPSVTPLPADLPPGTWTVGPDGERVPLAPEATPVDEQPASEVSAAADGPADPTDPVAATPEDTPTPESEPTPDSSAENNPEGDAMTSPVTVNEVQSNDALRHNFQQMATAAQKLAEAAAMAEDAKKTIAALAQANVDGVGAQRFDAGATAAAADVAAAVQDKTLTNWAETADNLHAAAKAGYDALEKYRASEEQVASEQIDGKVLEPTAS